LNALEIVFAALTADTAVVALVQTRIFPNSAPQGQTFPMVVFQVEDSEHYGTFGQPMDLTLCMVRVLAYSESALQAETLKNRCLKAVHQYQPSPGSERRCFVPDGFDASSEFDEDLSKHVSTFTVAVQVEIG
jgi:hypothetical protein